MTVENSKTIHEGGELTDEQDAKLDKFIEEAFKDPEFKKLVKKEQANHLSDEDIKDYVFEQLTEERRKEVLKHLIYCGVCFKEVKELEDMHEKIKEDYLNSVLPTSNNEPTLEPLKPMPTPTPPQSFEIPDDQEIRFFGPDDSDALVK